MRKINLISKIMTSQPGKQTIISHILSNTSRSKGNQIVKFGQLIECNMRNISFKKKNHTQNLLVKIFSDPFLWISNLSCQVEFYWNMLKLSCKPLAFTSYKAFYKNKKRSGTSLLASFSASFFKKNISLVIF